MDKMEEIGVKFEEYLMSDPESEAELLIVDHAPVLLLDGRYYTYRELFDGENVRENIIDTLKRVEKWNIFDLRDFR